MTEDGKTNHVMSNKGKDIIVAFKGKHPKTGKKYEKWDGFSNKTILYGISFKIPRNKQEKQLEIEENLAVATKLIQKFKNKNNVYVLLADTLQAYLYAFDDIIKAFKQNEVLYKKYVKLPEKSKKKQKNISLTKISFLEKNNDFKTICEKFIKKYKEILETEGGEWIIRNIKTTKKQKFPSENNNSFVQQNILRWNHWLKQEHFKENKEIIIKILQNKDKKSNTFTQDLCFQKQFKDTVNKSIARYAKENLKENIKNEQKEILRFLFKQYFIEEYAVSLLWKDYKTKFCWIAYKSKLPPCFKLLRERFFKNKKDYSINGNKNNLNLIDKQELCRELVLNIINPNKPKKQKSKQPRKQDSRNGDNKNKLPQNKGDINMFKPENKYKPNFFKTNNKKIPEQEKEKIRIIYGNMVIEIPKDIKQLPRNFGDEVAKILNRSNGNSPPKNNTTNNSI